MAPEVVQLTDNDLDATIQENPLVLVDFWAEWCFPCRMVVPTVEALAKEYEGKLLCARLNVDENPKAAMRFQVTSIPTFILFKDGRPVDMIIGAVPKSYFDTKIKAHL
jgi:thioredoxin 1